MAHVLEDVWDYTKGDPSAPPRFPPQVVKLSALLPSAQSLRQRIPIGLTVVSSSKVLWGTLTDEGLQE